MCFFRKKKNKGSVFYEEEPVDIKFSILADFVKELDSKADFNKAVGAMELIFNAYQKLRGIKTDEDIANDLEYMLHAEEGK